MSENGRALRLCVGIVLCSVVIFFIYPGFTQEPTKVRTIVVTTVIVLLLKFIVWDVVFFILKALFEDRFRRKTHVDPLPKRRQNNFTPTRTLFLKQRLADYKYRLLLTPKHRNEKLNLQYKLIDNELWMFARYYLLLLLVVVGTRNHLAYFNTYTLKTVFQQSYYITDGLGSVNKMDDSYRYIQNVLVAVLNAGTSYDGLPNPDPGWMQDDLAKLLGVVRLRQVRLTTRAEGLRKPEFEERNFMPGWQLPYKKLRYQNKFDHIYKPWVLQIYTDYGSFLLPAYYYGALHRYPSDKGYIAELARSQNDSMVILNFLKNNFWLDKKTAALFIDFTLYNVDSNMFSVCSIVLEQTPFGNIESYFDVQSADLLSGLDNASYMGLLILLLYVLQLIQFAKYLIVRTWYEPQTIKSVWSLCDCLIILLNVCAFTFVYFRDRSVAILMKEVEKSKKLLFVDFRIPTFIDSLASIFAGFLICLTTLRLWKLLQFAKVFRHFTSTLYTSKGSVFSALAAILVVIFAFGICSNIVNGNNAEHFSKITPSITTILSFGFGFNKEMDPTELSHGGATLGVTLYTALRVSVTVVLLNMFVVLIISYFRDVKKSQEEMGKIELNFWEFLKMEYAPTWRYWKNLLLPERYRRHKATLTENIEKELDKLHAEQQLKTGVVDNVPRELRHRDELERMDHLRTVAQILETQMEILKLELIELDIDFDTDGEDEVETEV